LAISNNDSNTNNSVNGSFTDLNSLIKDSNGYISLNNTYKYKNTTDSDLIEGLIIDKNLTIDGSGYSIDGNKSARLFKINKGVTLTLKNLNLTRAGNFSCAVLLNNGNLICDNCTFRYNNFGSHSIVDGIIYNNASLKLINCNFSNNYRCIYNRGVSYLENCNFSSGSGTGSGICFYNEGNLTITSCNFSNFISKEYSAGVIHSINNTLNITNSNFFKNGANTRGGVIEVYGNDVNIDNCSFINNYAGKYGGAIYSKANLTITRSLFDNNTINNNGLVTYCQHIYLYGKGDVNINYCIFLNNVSYDGPLGYICNNGNNTTANLQYNWWGSNDLNNTSGLVSGRSSGRSIVTNPIIMTVSTIPSKINVYNYTNLTNINICVDFNHYANGTTNGILKEKIPERLVKLVTDLNVNTTKAYTVNNLVLFDCEFELGKNMTITADNETQILFLNVDPVLDMNISSNEIFSGDSINVSIAGIPKDIEAYVYITGPQECSKNVSDGLFNFTFNKVGKYNITLVTCSTNIYNSVNMSLSFVVNKILSDLTILATPSIIAYGEKTKISINKYPKKSNFTVYVNNMKTNINVTSNGIFYYTPYKVGDFNISIIAENDTQIANGSIIVTVEKANINMSIDFKDNYTYGEDVLVKINFPNDCVNNAYLNFTYPFNKSFQSFIVGGIATFNLTDFIKENGIGNYKFIASYCGDDYYNEISDSFEFNCSKKISNLTVNASSYNIYYSFSSTISIDNYLKDSNLSIYINDEFYDIELINNSFILSPNKTGEYNILIIAENNTEIAEANLTLFVDKYFYTIDLKPNSTNITYGDLINVNVSNIPNEVFNSILINNQEVSIEIINNNFIFIPDKVGIFNITVIGLETDNYESSNNSFILTVNKIISNLDITAEPDTINFSDFSLISIKNLPYSSNTTIFTNGAINDTLQIINNSFIYNPSSIGKINITIISENDNEISEGSIILNINKDSSRLVIYTLNETITRGEKTELIIYGILNNSQLTIYDNNTLLSIETINNSFTANKSFIFEPDTPGQHNIYIMSVNDTQTSNSSITITVVNPIIELTATTNSTNLTLNDNITITISPPDAVLKLNLTVYDNSINITSNTSIKNNKIYYTVNSLGSHNITITGLSQLYDVTEASILITVSNTSSDYIINSTDETTLNSTNSTNSSTSVDINSTNSTNTTNDTHFSKVSTKLLFNNMTTNIVFNGKRNGNWFNVTLIDENDNPLSNKTIYIGFNGKIYKKTTNATGMTCLQINIGYQSANTFAITFLGDDNYEGKMDCALITVNPFKTKLTTTKHTYKSSAKTKTLKAILKTTNNLNIQGKTIIFSLGGDRIYTAKTNSKGIATINISLTTKKTYKYTATFDGDYQYSMITSTNKLVIK